MANDKTQSVRVSKNLKDLANSVQQITDDIYANTYYTSRKNSLDLGTIRDGIYKTLDSITQHNINATGKPNISTVYTRMAANAQSGIDKKDLEEFEGIFRDQTLMDTVASYYTANTAIQQYDAEIDLICKYMTKLNEAVEVKKDMVLCADQFNRDFLTIRDKSTIDDDALFSSEIAIIKDKYDLNELCDESCMRAYKYGEDFLYVVPYDRAFNQLLSRRKELGATGVVAEGVIESLNEHVQFDFNEAGVSFEKSNHDIGFTVTFNTQGIISESVRNIHNAASKLRSITEQSVNYPTSLEFSPDVIREAEDKHFSFTTIYSKLEKNKIIPDDTVPEKDDDDTRNRKISGVDGLIDPTIKKYSKKELSVSKIPACLIKRLPRDKVIPIYIEDLCMGYYYIEIQEDNLFKKGTVGFTSYVDVGQRLGQSAKKNNGTDDPLKDDANLKKVVTKLASMIDAKFINANQDISRELYMLLKYDEHFNQNTKNITITFIPPDDIEHIYFKFNHETHRGISLLDQAMIPAKIYIALSMCTAVGILTRSQDKRVYYVKQQVEKSISKTLMGAINQIKKSNFGVRNLENLMNTLNITGMYNDYFIAKSPGGDVPIDFEVMQGQQIDPNLEFLEKFEDYAVGTTGIPLDVITARLSVDYAAQLTMTNTKHIKMVYKDQAKAQGWSGRLITKIYNAEFSKASQLAVSLPPPMYVSLTNNSQLLTNAIDYATKIIEPELKAKGAEDTVIQAAIMAYVRKLLGTYMDFKDIDEVIRQAETSAAKATDEEEQ